MQPVGAEHALPLGRPIGKAHVRAAVPADQTSGEVAERFRYASGANARTSRSAQVCVG